MSGRGLCDELITRPEESYRQCCVVVCGLETSRMGAPYIYDISRLRVKCVTVFVHSHTKAAGAKVRRFVLIICVKFFSPVCGWVWWTTSAYTILMRKLDNYVHLKRRELNEKVN